MSIPCSVAAAAGRDARWRRHALGTAAPARAFCGVAFSRAVNRRASAPRGSLDPLPGNPGTSHENGSTEECPLSRLRLNEASRCVRFPDPGQNEAPRSILILSAGKTSENETTNSKQKQLFKEKKGSVRHLQVFYLSTRKRRQRKNELHNARIRTLGHKTKDTLGRRRIKEGLSVF